MSECLSSSLVNADGEQGRIVWRGLQNRQQRFVADATGSKANGSHQESHQEESRTKKEEVSFLENPALAGFFFSSRSNPPNICEGLILL